MNDELKSVLSSFILLLGQFDTLEISITYKCFKYFSCLLDNERKYLLSIPLMFRDNISLSK